MQDAASTFGLEVGTFAIRRTQDIVPAFEELKHRTEAIYLASEGLVDANRLRINILALGARLPTMWSQQELVEAGGSFPMDRTSRINGGAPPSMWTRFCAGPSRPTCRSSSRPSSISSST